MLGIREEVVQLEWSVRQDQFFEKTIGDVKKSNTNYVRLFDVVF